MVLPQAQPPAQIFVAQASGDVTAATRSRVTALEQAKDWPALADLMETLDPKSRGFLLETWLRALNKSGRAERLLQVCEAAIPQMEPKDNPKLTTGRLFRAQALSKLSRHREAADAHAENGRLGDTFGLWNACSEAQAGADWPLLEKLSQELVKQPPRQADARHWQAEALFQQSRMAEAEALFEQALQTGPGKPQAWIMLGACRAARHSYADALVALDKALGADPNSAEALFNRALVRFGMKQYGVGREDLLRAKALTGNSPAVQARLEENLRWVDEYLQAQAKPVAKERKLGSR